jgi:penicillin-binding protein 1A
MTPISVGLARSRNTMAVRAGNVAGIQRVREMAERSGLATGIPHYPSIYLGAFECTLRDLTSAYTAFPNQGVRPRPYVVAEIQDRYGRRVYLATRVASASFSPKAATTTSRMLEGVMRPGGTAAAAITRGVDFPAAGKTGTTDNYRDAWFVGYSGLLTGGVWVGFDERNRGLTQGYGSRLALPVWVKVMRTAKDAGYQFGKLP